MARVNLDGKVWKDPRVKRLARRRAMSLRETIGTLAAVWDVAYDNKTPIMPRIDVDTAAELEGWADDMVAEDLATAIGENLLDVRLRGVTERIDFLLSQAERGRLGGLAKAAAKRHEGTGLADAKQPLGEGQAFAQRPPSLPLDTSPSPTPALDIAPTHTQDHDAPSGARDVPADALRLAGLLHDLIAEHDPDGKTAKRSKAGRSKEVMRWAVDLEKLHRIDRIDWCDIEAAIRFARSTDFWKPWILSGDTVRKKFETLHAQLGQAKRAKSTADVRVGRVEPKDATEYADGEVKL